MTRKVAAIITAITGDRIVIGEEELEHAINFEQEKLSQYRLFYRLDNGKYLVVIIKKTPTGNYFSTMYSTGNSIRNAHKGLKEIKP